MTTPTYNLTNPPLFPKYNSIIFYNVFFTCCIDASVDVKNKFSVSHAHVMVSDLVKYGTMVIAQPVGPYLPYRHSSYSIPTITKYTVHF